MDVIRREAIYLWYYFDIQFRQIFGYWVFGIVIGSVISVFGKTRIHQMFHALQEKKLGGFGLLPLYVCGGGTIPLLQGWMASGMSVGSATAFMITGPATKITNLGAVKIVLGIKRFLLYIAFSMVFAFMSGLLVDLFV